MGNAVTQPGNVGKPLPTDYKGPIFVSDIDDTLRDTGWLDVVAIDRTAPPSYRGALETLHDVAGRRGHHVPIVYLSAAPKALLADVNRAFLAPFPRGRLFMQPRMALDLLRTDTQERFKNTVLVALKRLYPGAWFVCLGDNRYRDPQVYRRRCALGLIRRALQEDEQLQQAAADGPGELVPFKEYDDELRQRIRNALLLVEPLHEDELVVVGVPPELVNLVHTEVVGGNPP